MTQAEVDYHRAKIADIEQDFVTFNERIFKFFDEMKPALEEWAKHLEYLIDTHQMDLAIDGISAYITKRCRELNVEVTPQWIRKSLSTKYKRGYETAEKETVSNTTPAELPELGDLEKADNFTITNKHESVVEYERDLASKLRATRDSKAIIEAEAEKRKLSLPNHRGAAKSTPKGEPAETSLSDELLNLSEDILAVREKVIEFPPEEKDAAVWAKGIRNFRGLFNGYTDEKWSKSVPEWFAVQVTNIMYGKHAAATKHGIVLADGTKRSLTREQVGDNAEVILTLAKQLIESFDGLAGLVAWHKKNAEPMIAQRKVNLSGDLSAKA